MFSRKDKYINLGELSNESYQTSGSDLNPQSRKVLLSEDRIRWNKPVIKSVARIDVDGYRNIQIRNTVRFIFAVIAIIGSIYLFGPQIKKV